MSRIFKPKVSMPPVPPAPKPVAYNPPSSGNTEEQITNTPTESEIAAADPTGAINEDAEEAAIASVNKKKKGRKSTILTGPQGLTTEAETYSPTLLG
tara:strand:+ start:1358 stop:1648 length:291 start_codon:yes stop_codon:yes gene_type:complete